MADPVEDEDGTGDTGEGKSKGRGKVYIAPASQDEFDRIVDARLKQQHSDYSALKAKAQQWDVLEAESRTDSERRERELREEAFHEAMSKMVPVAVRAAFSAEAKGIWSEEQIDSYLEDRNLTAYADDDGVPDVVKIRKQVTAFASAKGGSGQNGRGPGFGQGNGHQRSTKSRGEDGLAEAKRRFPEQFAAQKS